MVNCSTVNVNSSYCHLHQRKGGGLPAIAILAGVPAPQGDSAADIRLMENLDLTVGYRFQDRMGTYTDTEGEVKSLPPLLRR